MKSWLVLLMMLSVFTRAVADPEADRIAFVKFYEQRFPNIEVAAHKDGTYALDAAKREQWLEMEDFPPYEIAVDEGESLFSIPFANGDRYADCFANDGLGVKQNYREAVKWFRNAADKGDVKVIFNLGVMHANGNGVQQNYTEAGKWIRKAADRGHLGAKAALERLKKK